ncbi:hypothetical protein GQ53DRAFT_829446 [Thozetella sp. PMI_491]|nr:hypothetical protein GQ53DRAFT_829446 [Thozetella sp. PMI_491]
MEPQWPDSGLLHIAIATILLPTHRGCVGRASALGKKLHMYTCSIPQSLSSRQLGFWGPRKLASACLGAGGYRGCSLSVRWCGALHWVHLNCGRRGGQASEGRNRPTVACASVDVSFAVRVRSGSPAANVINLPEAGNARWSISRRASDGLHSAVAFWESKREVEKGGGTKPQFARLRLLGDARRKAATATAQAWDGGRGRGPGALANEM